MKTALPPELRLVARCCRWPRADDDNAEIQSIVDGGIDWHRLTLIVRRNRVGPLVHHALTRVEADMPQDTRMFLYRCAHDAARRSLTLARESMKLQESIEAAGVPVIIVKGIPLAILAYGDLGMKESADIDVLVPPDAAIEVRQMLIEQGYEVSLDNLTADQFARHVRHTTEAGFLNLRTGLKVDLHWRLVANKSLLPRITAEGPLQHVAVPGGSLRTLSDEALFAYLCLHGALHNWGRLKWLADLGAFLNQRTEAKLAEFCEASAAYKVRRSASVALLLCRNLLGLQFPDELFEAKGKGSIAARLAANAMTGLSHRGGTAEHDHYTLPWARSLAAQFVLEPGVSQFRDQLPRLWNSPYDRARIVLPKGFELGYHLLRLPLWLSRIIKRALGQLGPLAGLHRRENADGGGCF